MLAELTPFLKEHLNAVTLDILEDGVFKINDPVKRAKELQRRIGDAMLQAMQDGNKLPRENPKGKAYIVHARTGCTCCENENFIQGPYKTQESALNQAEYFHNLGTLASQYAPKGVYVVGEVDYEELLNGRVIIEDKVGDQFIVRNGFEYADNFLSGQECHRLCYTAVKEIR